MSPPIPHKMVFLVRGDLKMGVGKIAAQVGHATLGAYQLAKKMVPLKVTRWEEEGCAKIVLKVKDEAELLTIAKNAQKDGLPVYTVQDAGRTQVEPGTITVCGIGPSDAPSIDKHTGTLSLL